MEFLVLVREEGRRSHSPQLLPRTTQEAAFKCPLGTLPQGRPRNLYFPPALWLTLEPPAWFLGFCLTLGCWDSFCVLRLMGPGCRAQKDPLLAPVPPQVSPNPGSYKRVLRGQGAPCQPRDAALTLLSSGMSRVPWPIVTSHPAGPKELRGSPSGGGWVCPRWGPGSLWRKLSPGARRMGREHPCNPWLCNLCRRSWKVPWDLEVRPGGRESPKMIIP